jgi:tRNA (mo5U34)-methyltransferase
MTSQYQNTQLKLTVDQIRAKIAAVPYWFHRIELAEGIVTPGEDDTPAKARWFELPTDLKGKRVLDIGCYEGYFSFECERRGAEVVAIDIIPPNTGFSLVHETLQSTVNFRQASIYELTPENFGEFDLVLCLGVIYHLRHPLLGLERIHSICKDQLIIETQICDHYFIDSQGQPQSLVTLAPNLADQPIVQFYPGAQLNNDPSNWWAPNLAALNGMLVSSGFQPTKVIQNGVRACIHCQRVDAPFTPTWYGDVL